jgi:methionyl-tRNA formyltransferase
MGIRWVDPWSCMSNVNARSDRPGPRTRRAPTLRVVLAAAEAAGVQALRALADSGCELVAVLTDEPPAARGVTVADLARRLGCPVWPGAAVRDATLAERLRGESVDLLVNVHSLHRIHADVVEAPASGSFNLHPGPLPAFAGLNAPSWAVYLGERRHAVTVHRMTATIDTGDVCYEAWFDLDDAATGLSVSTRCVRLGIPLISRLLHDVESGTVIPARPQHAHQRRLFRRGEVPHGGRIPWQASAAELARWVRASDFHPLPSPWGYPATRLGDRELQIAKAEPAAGRSAGDPGTVMAVDAHGATIATGDGALFVRTLISDSQRVTAADRLEPGMMLT